MLSNCPLGYKDLREYADALLDFLNKYQFLWKHNAVDFYVNDYWNNEFPKEWRILEQNSFQSLLSLASCGLVQDNWPQSLKEFIIKSKSIPLARNLEPNQSEKAFVGTVNALDNRLAYKISSKKKHEVENMAAFISRVCLKQDIHNIVDVGAGQGYLDLSLSYQYGLNVIGVDDDEQQIQGAKRKREKFSPLFHQAIEQGQCGTLHLLNKRFDHTESFDSVFNSNCKTDNKTEPLVSDTTISLDDQVSMYPPSNTTQSSDSINEKWLLCGLHTCGDLAPNIMRQFLQGSATALINVGCCYNHVTELADLHAFQTRDWSISELWAARKEGSVEPGFPMSQYLMPKNIKLGYIVRTMACQSVLRWSENEKKSIQQFHRQFHRAVLQSFIVDRRLVSNTMDTRDIHVGRMCPDAYKHGFSTYAIHALTQMNLLDKTGLSIEALRKDLHEYKESFEGTEIQVAAAWTLRALLSDVIESLILVDRILYLQEGNADRSFDVNMVLLPLFDQSISPRNMVICAWKSHNSN